MAMFPAVSEADRYSDREVEEILRRALQSNEGLDHEVLREAAAEVGIESSRIDRAAEAVLRDRAVQEKLELNKRRRRRGLMRHATVWAVIVAFLAALDFLTPGGPWWYFPALGWFLGLAMHAVSLAFHDEERERERLMRREQRLRARALKKEARRARFEARRLSHRRKGHGAEPSDAELAFEEAVERGLAALLSGAARTIDKALENAQREIDPSARGEFGAYVDERRGATPRQAQPANAPQVRVDARADEVEEVGVEAGGEARRTRER